jgi:hypothetical protein
MTAEYDALTGIGMPPGSHLAAIFVPMGNEWQGRRVR